MAKGATMLARLRMNTFWMGADLAKRGLWQPVFLNQCPCCGTNEGETREHMVLRCSAFDRPREHITGLIHKATYVCWQGASDTDVLTVVLGGAAKSPHGDTRSLGSFQNRYLPLLLKFLNKVAYTRPKFLKANQQTDVEYVETE